MKLKEIVDFIDERIPEAMALNFDNVGLMGDYDLNYNIDSIKILMDLLPEDDDFDENTLIVTHHPPLFKPETPTYTIHSNWDIIDGGANEALAETLGLNVVGYFDEATKIGRICKSNHTFKGLENIILDNFGDARVVNCPDDFEEIEKVGIISGFGLKNPNYIKLADQNNLDVLISGDLTQETAILAKNLHLTLIDLGHHESEVPGLCRLAEVFNSLDVECEIIDKKPIERLL